MVEVKVTTIPGDFSIRKKFDDIVTAFSAKMEELATKVKERIQRRRLSERGPQSLGIVTGRLYNSMRTEVGDTWFRIFVDPSSKASVYGERWEEEKKWFSMGIEDNKGYIKRALDKALEDETNKVRK